MEALLQFVRFYVPFKKKLIDVFRIGEVIS